MNTEKCEETRAFYEKAAFSVRTSIKKKNSYPFYAWNNKTEVSYFFVYSAGVFPLKYLFIITFSIFSLETGFMK
ncbi:MAG: hypothetical protein PWQ77_1585 [Kosmotogales bacterium]|nr:hypothetical protein [Kosmotogales bacterium]